MNRYVLYLLLFILVPKLVYTQHEVRIYMHGNSSHNYWNYLTVKKISNKYITNYGFSSFGKEIDKEGFLVTRNVHISKSPICIKRSKNEYYLLHKDGNIKKIDLPINTEFGNGDFSVYLYFGYLIVHVKESPKKIAIIPVSLNKDSLKYYDDVRTPGRTAYSGNDQSNNNRGIALNLNGRWALFDTLLQQKSDFIYEKVFGGYYGWFVGNDVSTKYITHEGKILIDSLDGIYWEFGNILRREVREGGEGGEASYKYIDRSNKTLVEKTKSPYIDVGVGLIPFNNSSGKYGYINKFGDTIVSPIYEYVFARKGIIVAKKKESDTKLTWITKTGKILNISNINFAINDSTLCIKKGNKYGIVDVNNHEIYPPQFDELICEFFGIVIKMNGRYGLLAANGREYVYPVEYQQIKLFEDKIYLQKDRTEKYLVKYTGEVIYKFKENELFSSSFYTGHDDISSEAWVFIVDYFNKKNGIEDIHRTNSRQTTSNLPQTVKPTIVYAAEAGTGNRTNRVLYYVLNGIVYSADANDGKMTNTKLRYIVGNKVYSAEAGTGNRTNRILYYIINNVIYAADAQTGARTETILRHIHNGKVYSAEAGNGQRTNFVLRHIVGTELTD